MRRKFSANYSENRLTQFSAFMRKVFLIFFFLFSLPSTFDSCLVTSTLPPFKKVTDLTIRKLREEPLLIWLWRGNEPGGTVSGQVHAINQETKTNCWREPFCLILYMPINHFPSIHSQAEVFFLMILTFGLKCNVWQKKYRVGVLRPISRSPNCSA